jgi:hypothetical protein
MKATPNEPHAPESGLEEAAPEHHGVAKEGIDLGLLKDSLAKTPWERMQANDDALRFADTLSKAMEERHAKLKRTDPQAH